ncbi:MAG: IS256 family transposase [Candidatus Bipolaricaulis sp.]|nr:IS256 family transposase [Candidatus Bipolaricaulis sp.]
MTDVAEVSGKTGAENYERSAERMAYRNGYRERAWDTRVGTIPLRIPRLRTGTYFPSVASAKSLNGRRCRQTPANGEIASGSSAQPLPGRDTSLIEPRRRAERAVVSVIQEAYVHGVSTRKVDDLVRSLGMEGISKSEVSRLCGELDVEMQRFRDRRLEGEYPYVWLDGKCVKVRQDRCVENYVAIVAVGVTQSGQREILGFDIGPAESHDFWLGFLRGLAQRGLRGTHLVISYAYEDLKQAIAEVLAGAAWQRCRVHFMRNLLALVPKRAQTVTAAWVRSIFAQPDASSARDQLDKVARALESKLPRVSELLRSAEHDILAYMTFPTSHWQKLHSTNTIERVNREIERRTGVVGIFPNAQAALRLIGAVLEEQHEEWTEVRCYFGIESMALLYKKTEVVDASLALVVGEEVFVL